MIDIWMHRASYFTCGMAVTVAMISPHWIFIFASLLAGGLCVSAIREDQRQIAAYKRPLSERDIIKTV